MSDQNSPKTAVQDLVLEAVRHAREDLSYAGALVYLRRMATALDSYPESAAPLREAIGLIREGDQQLHLILAGEIQLDLFGPNTGASQTAD